MHRVTPSHRNKYRCVQPNGPANIPAPTCTGRPPSGVPPRGSCPPGRWGARALEVVGRIGKLTRKVVVLFRRGRTHLKEFFYTFLCNFVAQLLIEVRRNFLHHKRTFADILTQLQFQHFLVLQLTAEKKNCRQLS